MHEGKDSKHTHARCVQRRVLTLTEDEAESLKLSSVLKNQLILEWPEPLSRLFSYSDSRNDGRLDGVDAILGGERSPPKHFASKEKRLLTPSQSKTLIGKRLLQLLKRKQFCPSEVDFFFGLLDNFFPTKNL